MKCIVWFDLPNALGNLGRDFISKNDQNYLSNLCSSTKVFFISNFYIETYRFTLFLRTIIQKLISKLFLFRERKYKS